MTLRICGVLFLLSWIGLYAQVTNPTRSLFWEDLKANKSQSFDDPFAELSISQLQYLAAIAQIRQDNSPVRSEWDRETTEYHQQLCDKLEGDGIKVDWVLSQRQRITKQRRKAAESVEGSILNKEVRIPGYMLPIEWKDQLVTRFLLVPWVGACIHTPPPAPDQIVHVTVPDGLKDKGRFAPIWIQGKLKHQPKRYQLFLVDGTRSVQVNYAMTSNQIETYSAADSDVLSRVEIPEFSEVHGWWRGLQAKLDIAFGKAMSEIRNRQNSKPVWIGILLAFVYGFIHTLGPGHGKAVVISYFIGTGGSLKNGISMGIQIAIFHVLSAVLVAWITDFTLRQVTGYGPSDFTIIRLLSYTMIVIIGVLMLCNTLKKGSSPSSVNHTKSCCSCHTKKSKGSLRSWLALAVGSVPCTGALLVLLFGMANNLLGPAILMVIAISGGMAIAMSSIGLLAIYGRHKAIQHSVLNFNNTERWVRYIQITGASTIILIGIVLMSLTWNTDTFG